MKCEMPRGLWTWLFESKESQVGRIVVHKFLLLSCILSFSYLHGGFGIVEPDLHGLIFSRSTASGSRSEYRLMFWYYFLQIFFFCLRLAILYCCDKALIQHLLYFITCVVFKIYTCVLVDKLVVFYSCTIMEGWLSKERCNISVAFLHFFASVCREPATYTYIFSIFIKQSC